jgi:hypothetical protein
MIRVSVYKRRIWYINKDMIIVIIGYNIRDTTCSIIKHFNNIRIKISISPCRHGLQHRTSGKHAAIMSGSCVIGMVLACTIVVTDAGPWMTRIRISD